jgi:hypothetical protein
MGRITFLAATSTTYVIVMFALASIPERTFQETVDAASTAAIN